jgi:hypothetical protein
MRQTYLAFLMSAAVAVAACSSETNPTPVGSGGAGGSSSSAGGAGGEGGEGGAGGAGGSMVGDKLEVGVGVQDITPMLVEKLWNDANDNDYYEVGEEFGDTNMNGVFDAVWIAGFGGGRPATGVSDPLEARAIALKYKDTTVVICVLDVVGYFIDEMEKIKADPIVAGLDVDHIIISSTHTHQAVDTVGLWGPDPMASGVNPDYQKLTRDKAALAIKQAVESLKPARMRVAQTQTVDMDGSTLAYHNDTRDPIIYDPTVTIAQFADDADPSKTIATLVNWAAHPEYAGSKNNLLSADYVHWLRDTVEKGVPDEGITGLGGTTVFVQGPLGGQVGPGGGVAPIGKEGTPILEAGLAKAAAAGTNVGKLALDALAKSGEDAAAFDITVRSKELYARVDNIGYQFAFQLGVLDRQLYNWDESMPVSETNTPELKSRITYLQVGPLAMITNPGELHPELWVGGYDGSWSWGQNIVNEAENAPDLAMAPAGPYLREIMLSNPNVKYVFCAGLAEDFIGYIVPAFNYVLDEQNPYFAEAAGDHYEETNSVGPKVEEQILHPMLDLAKPPPAN